MPRQSVFDMKVSKVYPLLVAKAETKGRTKAEVDEVTASCGARSGRSRIMSGRSERFPWANLSGA